MDLVGLPALGLEARRLLRIGSRALQHLARGVGADRRAAAAQELVERHAGRLGGDVPQRRVAGADRAQAHVALAGAHGRVQLFPR